MISSFIVLAIAFVIFVLWQKTKRKSHQDSSVYSNPNKYDLIVESFTDDSTYQINFKEYRCTCPNFTKKRMDFDIGDPRRMCKHLVHAFIETDGVNLGGTPKHLIRELNSAYEGQRGFPSDKKVISEDLTIGEIAGYISTSGNPWVNLYLDDEYVGGYNVKEQRWAYGEEPKNRLEFEKWTAVNWGEINNKNVSLPDEDQTTIKLIEIMEGKGKRKILKASLSSYTIIIDISGSGGKWIDVEIYTKNGKSFYSGAYSIKEKRWIKMPPLSRIKRVIEDWITKEWQRINK